MLRLLQKEQPVYDTCEETFHTSPSWIRTVDILRKDCFFLTTRYIKELIGVYTFYAL